MESDVAKYISSLEKTIPDCKLSLKKVKVIVECYNDPECDPKSLMRGLEVDTQSPQG